MKLPLNYFLKYKRTIKLLLGTPLTIAALIFILLSVYSRKDVVLNDVGSLNFTLLVISVFLYIPFFLLKGIVWLKILKFLGSKTDPVNDIYLLSSSELKRYIPGNVLAFVSRVSSYSQKQTSKSTLKGIILEQILLVASSFTVAVPAILYFGPKFFFPHPLFLNKHALILTFLMFMVLVVLLGIYIVKKKVKRGLTLNDVQELLSMYTLSVLAWIFFGIASYIGALSFRYLDPLFFLQFCSFFVLSWLVGYLSFVTPMGLGVREAVITGGLMLSMPASFASLIAVLLRIIFTLSELLFLLILKLIKRAKGTVRILENTNKFYICVLIFFVLLYSSFFSYFSIDRHNNFYSGRFDLGNMDQTIWNTLHGRIFMFTNPDSTENVSRLVFHADFILILLTPFYVLWSDPRILLIIQSIVISFGAFFIYFLSNEVVKKRSISLIFAAGYLMNPFLQRMNIYDFHAVALATTFLLGSFYFLYTKKWFWGVIFLILSVLSKENIYIIAFFIGAYLFISGKNKRLGLVISFVSLFSFVLIMKVFIPNLRGANHFAFKFLSNFGNSTEDVIVSLVTNPLEAVKTALQNRGDLYLFRMLLPVGFTSLLALPYLLFASADITKNVLASNSNFRDIYYQYWAEIIPFVYISAMFAVSFLLRKFKRFSVFAVCVYLVFFSSLSWWLYSPLPGAKRANVANFRNTVPEKNEILQAVSQIPQDKSVSTTNNLGAHLSQRENLYTVPLGQNSADYVLYYLKRNTREYETEYAEVRKKMDDQKYILYFKTGDFYAFKKKY